MNNYITGKIIKELKEKQNLTQIELANIIGVSDKTISKWETGKGLPDISFIAYITNDRCEIVKLYPEQNAEVRFLKRGKGILL